MTKDQFVDTKLQHFTWPPSCIQDIISSIANAATYQQTIWDNGLKKVIYEVTAARLSLTNSMNNTLPNSVEQSNANTGRRHHTTNSS